MEKQKRTRIFEELSIFDAIASDDEVSQWCTNTSHKLPMRFPVYIWGNSKDIEANALLDCRATGLFIHQDYVKKHQIPTKPYARPKTIQIMDNLFNILGKTSNYVKTWLTIGDHEEQV